MQGEMILILDFGSQTTQLIARRIREQRVYCEIHPFNLTIEKIQTMQPKGIILSGGPASVYDPGAPVCAGSILDLNIPILGICYGAQFLTMQVGGRVERAEKREFGKADLEVIETTGLFAGLEKGKLRYQVWMSHGDLISELPENFITSGSSSHSPYAAFRHQKRPWFGVQFHPEVAHTLIGTDVLRNFIFGICQCRPQWTMQSFVETAVQKIQHEVRDGRIICALSGGVDSAVTAALIHQAVGNRLFCIFVNNGVLRTNEAESVLNFFQEKTGLNIFYKDASQTFLRELRGVIDPEEKRKCIGHGFIRIFEEEAKKLGDIQFLAQGTLYPDVIESVSQRGPSAVIKSHHNVGGLPQRMHLSLIEPLRELFKDEVRELGLELGLPEEVVFRQPFPGPGLAIRILGEVTEERLKVLRQADIIVLEEMKRHGWYRKVWQSFAVLLPIRTVGVMGDERTYENVIALRVVDSLDAMTADWTRVPYDLLSLMSNRIINEVKGVNRVVFDISSKPPSTIEWE